MLKARIALLISFLVLVAAPAWAQLYTATNGTATRDRRDRDAVLVQVDGSVEATRDFWQEYMKDTYSIRFKSKTLAALGIKGKKDELSAPQATGAGISSKPVDLYVNLNAVNDSTTEVALFGGFGDKTFFEPGSNASEFASLRKIMEKFAVAARSNAYEMQVKEAEHEVAAVEKEQDKLTKSIQSAQSNTASNLKRIEEMLSKNRSNALQMHQDSVQIATNAKQQELNKARLQRRRERAATVGRK